MTDTAAGPPYMAMDKVRECCRVNLRTDSFELWWLGQVQKFWLVDWCNRAIEPEEQEGAEYD